MQRKNVPITRIATDSQENILYILNMTFLFEMYYVKLTKPGTVS